MGQVFHPDVDLVQSVCKVFGGGITNQPGGWVVAGGNRGAVNGHGDG